MAAMDSPNASHSATLTPMSDDVVLIEMPMKGETPSSPGRVELGA